MEIDASVRRQCRTSDPLKTRIETHRLYEERRVDLDVECWSLLGPTGLEAILDVGCGPGRFLIFLRDRGHVGRLVGLDQSSAMIAEGAASAAEKDLAIEWLVGSANELPVREATLDWVVARHMLYHVPDMVGALREFARVVGPNGGVLVSTGSRQSLPRITELRFDVLAAFGLHRAPRVQSVHDRERHRNPWCGFSLRRRDDPLQCAGLHYPRADRAIHRDHISVGRRAGRRAAMVGNGELAAHRSTASSEPAWWRLARPEGRRHLSM